MATVQEIEREIARVRELEVQAVENLCEHVRNAVVELPASSELAQTFVSAARLLEQDARWMRESAEWSAGLSAMRLASDVHGMAEEMAPDEEQD